ncbi:flowering time control protein FCA-like [Actinidia eriantha]|uniref:flowering time control protein FCA-like n=1 Tax=Actinidia eriantha TaxID=165200 RepID=UPI002590D5CC|nr:flowering time control protein FCA-like [Actinidia eriantha]
MRGCDQPLIVCFAHRKKLRMGESRDNCKFGGSSIGSCFQEAVVRPPQYLDDQMAEDMLPSASLPPSPKTMASSSQIFKNHGRGGIKTPQLYTRGDIKKRKSNEEWAIRRNQQLERTRKILEITSSPRSLSSSLESTMTQVR